MHIVVMPTQGQGSSPERLRVEPSEAFTVARAAERALRQEIRQLTAELISKERARRRRFNASWAGKVLFFWREDPDGEISLEELLAPGAEGLLNGGDFVLYAYHQLLDTAENLQRRAQNTTTLWVNAIDWDNLQKWGRG